jgi:hypothetical protein
MKYPKINSLWKRKGHDYDQLKAQGIKPPKASNKLIPGLYSLPEFETITRWTITEKIDGTNIRIIWDADTMELKIKGRNEDSMIPPHLLEYLQQTFYFKNLKDIFPKGQTILFGEGFGPKIQCGEYYSDTPKFALFDVYHDGWWFERDNVHDVAEELEIVEAPLITNDDCTAIWNTDQIVNYVKSKPKTCLLTEQWYEIEGIVARPYPMLRTRNGAPIFFKLRCKDV